MAIYHLPLGDIAKMEWEDLAYFHDEAIKFYKADKEITIRALAGALGASLFGGVDVVSN